LGIDREDDPLGGLVDGDILAEQTATGQRWVR
jgi:hypothetical protein